MNEQEVRFGVFQHSSGREGGIVVRTLLDGTPAFPYKLNDCLCIYKRKSAAQKYANKLNAAARFAAHGYDKPRYENDDPGYMSGYTP